MKILSKISNAPLVPAKAVPPGASLRWEVVIPAVPPSENTQRRTHWGGLRADAKAWLWWMKLAFSCVPKAKGPRHVLFIREAHGLLDEGDNLGASYKFVRDLLRPERVDKGVYGPKTKTPGVPWMRVQAGIGMVVGDGPGEATFEYQQRKVPRSQPVRTFIVISEGAEKKLKNSPLTF